MSSKKPAGFYVADPAILLRELTPDDWEIFRALRLRAIRMHTNLFSDNPDEAEKRPPAHWQDTLNGQGKAVFGLFDDHAPIGLTAVFTSREDPGGQSGVMAMSFIEPPYRGRGYSSLYYKARIDFACAHLPWKTLTIAHREGNEASRRAILQHGFTLTRTEDANWPDGTRGLKHFYEMNLEPLRIAGRP